MIQRRPFRQEVTTQDLHSNIEELFVFFNSNNLTPLTFDNKYIGQSDDG